MKKKIGKHIIQHLASKAREASNGWYGAKTAEAIAEADTAFKMYIEMAEKLGVLEEVQEAFYASGKEAAARHR